MSPEDFYNKYPNLFMKEIYFECAPGWFPLLDELCEKLEKLIIKEKEVRDPEDSINWYVVQIKEKYGTLRFYMSAASEEMYKLIHEAENKSAKICEECGKEGKLRNKNYWYSTECDECSKKS